ncbi:MAG: transposase [Muribaculaceae bacterium]|nr:transposase [Muribaculaceae bacterium]
MKHNNSSSAGYSTDLTPVQTILLKANLGGALSKLRKYKPKAINNAISYVVKTGCQWSMLPVDFPM